jgi:hypothetical protein
VEIDKKDCFNHSGAKNFNKFKNGKYTVSFLWNAVPYERMKEGLAKIQGDESAISSNVLKWILGKPDLSK